MQTTHANPRGTVTVLALSMLLLAGSLLLASGALALQSYDISWWTVDGGGGGSNGGNYVLEGTAGQPDPGPSLSGGDYIVEGGFWGGRLSGVTFYEIYLPLIVRSFQP